MRKTILAAGMVAAFLFASCSENAAPVVPQSKPSPVQSAPPALDPRIIYDLREKCGRDTREWFKHFYGDGSSRTTDGESHSSYTNHYNERLNRCYALLASTGFIRDSKTHKVRMSDDRTLVDVSENRDLGNYFKFSDMDRSMACNIGDKNCASRGEWEGLVAPYMEQ
jgi:hypothetical protein